MPSTQHNTQSPVTREISYDWEDDTLWVGNGGSPSGGIDLSPRCIVFFDPGCVNANAFTFDDAREIILPVLQGQVTREIRYEGPEEDAVMIYDRETDTLRLQNSLPNLVRKDIFDGCSVFLERDKGLVSAIVLERAAELLLPVLTAEPADADSS